MNKKLLFTIVGSILTLALLVFFAEKGRDYHRGTTNKNTIVSEVKVANSVPKIFFNGKEFPVVAAQIYSYPDSTKYGSDWSAKVKKTIDTEKAVGANVLLLHLWWSDLDKSISRPNNLGDNLEFSYVDEVMDYANKTGMKIVLLPMIHTMIPEWWKKEQGFPNSSLCMPKEVGASRTCIPKELCNAGEKNCCSKDTKELICCDMATSEPDFTTNPPTAPKPIAVTLDYKIFKCISTNDGVKYTSCSSCETDSAGWKYNNPSMGYDKVRADYGEYLAAIINRYKNHPALLGWDMGVGFSGEDLYGPSYIAIQNLIGFGGFQDSQALRGRIADYSEVFNNLFKTWLTAKYKTTVALQNAWGDTNVDLENFKIPLLNELFVDGKPHPIPEGGYLNYLVALNDLTKKGMDFYIFREEMKTKDSKYYSNLFKTLDPNHILAFNSYENFEEYTNKNINGFLVNPNLNSARSASYEQALPYLILASKYGQFTLGMYENNNVENHDDESQLNILEASGKVGKCFGAGFGYVTTLSGMEQSYPGWTSEKAKQVIRDIIAYTPTENCKCEFINNNSNTWHGKTIKEILAMHNITGYDYCGDTSNEDGSANATSLTQGKCGDGVCDNVEKESGMCSQDCK